MPSAILSRIAGVSGKATTQMDTTLLWLMRKLSGKKRDQSEFLPKDFREFKKCLSRYTMAILAFVFSVVVIFIASTDKKAVTSKMYVYLFLIAFPILLGCVLVLPVFNNAYNGTTGICVMLIMTVVILSMYFFYLHVNPASVVYMNMVLLILSLLVILACLGIFYKVMVRYINNLRGWTGFILKFIFYIPCLVGQLVEYLYLDYTHLLSDNAYAWPIVGLFVIFICIILFLVYLPNLRGMFTSYNSTKQGFTTIDLGIGDIQSQIVNLSNDGMNTVKDVMNRFIHSAGDTTKITLQYLYSQLMSISRDTSTFLSNLGDWLNELSPDALNASIHGQSNYTLQQLSNIINTSSSNTNDTMKAVNDWFQGLSGVTDKISNEATIAFSELSNQLNQVVADTNSIAKKVSDWMKGLSNDAKNAINRKTTIAIDQLSNVLNSASSDINDKIYYLNHWFTTVFTQFPEVLDTVIDTQTNLTLKHLSEQLTQVTHTTNHIISNLNQWMSTLPIDAMSDGITNVSSITLQYISEQLNSGSDAMTEFHDWLNRLSPDVLNKPIGSTKMTLQQINDQMNAGLVSTINQLNTTFTGLSDEVKNAKIPVFSKATWGQMLNQLNSGSTIAISELKNWFDRFPPNVLNQTIAGSNITYKHISDNLKRGSSESISQVISWLNGLSPDAMNREINASITESTLTLKTMYEQLRVGSINEFTQMQNWLNSLSPDVLNQPIRESAVTLQQNASVMNPPIRESAVTLQQNASVMNPPIRESAVTLQQIVDIMNSNLSGAINAVSTQLKKLNANELTAAIVTTSNVSMSYLYNQLNTQTQSAAYQINNWLSHLSPDVLNRPIIDATTNSQITLQALYNELRKIRTKTTSDGVQNVVLDTLYLLAPYRQNMDRLNTVSQMTLKHIYDALNTGGQASVSQIQDWISQLSPAKLKAPIFTTGITLQSILDQLKTGSTDTLKSTLQRIDTDVNFTKPIHAVSNGINMSVQELYAQLISASSYTNSIVYKMQEWFRTMQSDTLKTSISVTNITLQQLFDKLDAASTNMNYISYTLKNWISSLPANSDIIRQINSQANITLEQLSNKLREASTDNTMYILQDWFGGLNPDVLNVVIHQQTKTTLGQLSTQFNTVSSNVNYVMHNLNHWFNGLTPDALAQKISNGSSVTLSELQDQISKASSYTNHIINSANIWLSGLSQDKLNIPIHTVATNMNNLFGSLNTQTEITMQHVYNQLIIANNQLRYGSLASVHQIKHWLNGLFPSVLNSKIGGKDYKLQNVLDSLQTPTNDGINRVINEIKKSGIDFSTKITTTTNVTLQDIREILNKANQTSVAQLQVWLNQLNPDVLNGGIANTGITLREISTKLLNDKQGLANQLNAVGAGATQTITTNTNITLVKIRDWISDQRSLPSVKTWLSTLSPSVLDAPIANTNFSLKYISNQLGAVGTSTNQLVIANLTEKINQLQDADKQLVIDTVANINRVTEVSIRNIMDKIKLIQSSQRSTETELNQLLNWLKRISVSSPELFNTAIETAKFYSMLYITDLQTRMNQLGADGVNAVNRLIDTAGSNMTTLIQQLARSANANIQLLIDWAKTINADTQVLNGVSTYLPIADVSNYIRLRYDFLDQFNQINMEGIRAMDNWIKTTSGSTKQMYQSLKHWINQQSNASFQSIKDWMNTHPENYWNYMISSQDIQTFIAVRTGFIDQLQKLTADQIGILSQWIRENINQLSNVQFIAGFKSFVSDTFRTNADLVGWANNAYQSSASYVLNLIDLTNQMTMDPMKDLFDTLNHLTRDEANTIRTAYSRLINDANNLPLYNDLVNIIHHLPSNVSENYDKLRSWITTSSKYQSILNIRLNLGELNYAIAMSQLQDAFSGFTASEIATIRASVIDPYTQAASGATDVFDTLKNVIPTFSTRSNKSFQDWMDVWVTPFSSYRISPFMGKAANYTEYLNQQFTKQISELTNALAVSELNNILSKFTIDALDSIKTNVFDPVKSGTVDIYTQISGFVANHANMPEFNALNQWLDTYRPYADMINQSFDIQQVKTISSELSMTELQNILNKLNSGDISALLTELNQLKEITDFANQFSDLVNRQTSASFDTLKRWLADNIRNGTAANPLFNVNQLTYMLSMSDLSTTLSNMSTDTINSIQKWFDGQSANAKNLFTDFQTWILNKSDAEYASFKTWINKYNPALMDGLFNVSDVNSQLYVSNLQNILNTASENTIGTIRKWLSQQSTSTSSAFTSFKTWINAQSDPAFQSLKNWAKDISDMTAINAFWSKPMLEYQLTMSQMNHIINTGLSSVSIKEFMDWTKENANRTMTNAFSSFKNWVNGKSDAQLETFKELLNQANEYAMNQYFSISNMNYITSLSSLQSILTNGSADVVNSIYNEFIPFVTIHENVFDKFKQWVSEKRMASFNALKGWVNTANDAIMQTRFHISELQYRVTISDFYSKIRHFSRDQIAAIENWIDENKNKSVNLYTDFVGFINKQQGSSYDALKTWVNDPNKRGAIQTVMNYRFTIKDVTAQFVANDIQYYLDTLNPSNYVEFQRMIQTANSINPWVKDNIQTVLRTFNASNMDDLKNKLNVFETEELQQIAETITSNVDNIQNNATNFIFWSSLIPSSKENQLLGNPVPLNRRTHIAYNDTFRSDAKPGHALSSHHLLTPNAGEAFRTNYGISMWLNMNNSYRTNPNGTPVLYYGTVDSTNASRIHGHPSLVYTNNETNRDTLIVYLSNTDPTANVKLTIPGQKWHLISVNYESGKCDVFLNGNLEKSFMFGSRYKMPTYSTSDVMIVGWDYPNGNTKSQGAEGSICNVNYYKESMKQRQIANHYNMYMYKSPPN